MVEQVLDDMDLATGRREMERRVVPELQPTKGKVETVRPTAALLKPPTTPTRTVRLKFTSAPYSTSRCNVSRCP